MLAVGTDIVEIARIERAVFQLGQAFLSRVYTPAEQSDCSGRPDRLAALFALKEAVSKALGVGLACVNSEGIEFCDVEVFAPLSKAPSLRLHGLALARAEGLGLNQWSISLACSRHLVVACVVAGSSFDARIEQESHANPRS
jgi:holo-[acyl-carrier protein] synthase